MKVRKGGFVILMQVAQAAPVAHASVDWWARGMAAGALAVGFLTLYMNFVRGRLRVRIDFRTNRFAHTSDDESEIVSIKVRVRGRPIAVENVSVRPVKEQVGIGLMMTNIELSGKQPELPKLMTDGDSQTWTYHLRAFRSVEAPVDLQIPTSSRAVAEVTLSSGKTFKSEVHTVKLTTADVPGHDVGGPPLV